MTDIKTSILGKYISNDDLHNEYDIYKAMDEYASKDAIEFSEWCAEQGWEKHIGEDTWFNRMGYVTEYATEKLYELYKISLI